MRIASLVPSATEMLYALGLGGDVVAVTHECDYPGAVRSLPRLTRSVIPAGLDAARIDAAVKERTLAGESLYELDRETLASLEVDLIVTQAVCAVCAVAFDEVRAIASELPGPPAVISLDPEDLGDVLDDAVRLGDAAGIRPAGEELRRRLQTRIDRVRAATASAPPPRVAALEWLDPPYAGGHWVPEMIAAAGGRCALAEPGQRSPELAWEDVIIARPEVLVAMPCGLNCDEAVAEADRAGAALARVGARRAFAVDAAASFSRPGPRLADGVELLGHLLHPDLVEAPKGLRWRELAADGRTGA
jgi:iron complex transport system substrate-binding protein